MVRGYVDASAPGQPSVIDGTRNFVLYQKILKDNLLKHTWVWQQNNNPTYTNKSTSDLKKEKKKVV